MYINIIFLSNVTSKAVIFSHKCFHYMSLSVNSTIPFNYKCFSVRYMLGLHLSNQSLVVVRRRSGKLEFDLILAYVKSGGIVKHINPLFSSAFVLFSMLTISYKLLCIFCDFVQSNHNVVLEGHESEQHRSFNILNKDISFKMSKSLFLC